MELYEVMRTTFAARDYTGEDISDALLYEILENARFAPSGGNRQGNRVLIIRDPNTRQQISQMAIPAAKRYAAQIKAGDNPWNSLHPPTPSVAEIEATEPPPTLLNSYLNASVVLVFLVDLNVVAAMDQDLDRVGVVAGASIYPFVWNVLLASRQAGFGGTFTTLPIAEEPRLKKLLNVPQSFAVAALVPIGKPVKQLTKLKRRPVEEIAVREKFDGEAFTV